MRNFIFPLFFMLATFGWSQDLVINELDVDTPSTDDKEFIEIKSTMPNQVISNQIIVLFNGSTSGNNASYLVIDLDGQKTDGNGLLLIGSREVSPFPQLLIPVSVIQNGADAIAIYNGTPDDFPNLTVATIDNLVDVIVYDTNDSDDEDLLAIFRADPRFTDLQQINEGPGQTSKSIQRNSDGTYFTGTPSPRQTNDGSGAILNPVSVSVNDDMYDEGESFTISFMSELNVAQDTSFDIDLSNDGFTAVDFTGVTNITILAGQNMASTTISLVDDDDDEGDEELIIKIQN